MENCSVKEMAPHKRLDISGMRSSRTCQLHQKNSLPGSGDWNWQMRISVQLRA